jgi:ribosomal protein L35
MKLHILTNHSTKEERKKEMKYYCDKCDFGTNAEILFQRHLETQKHLN